MSKKFSQLFSKLAVDKEREVPAPARSPPSEINEAYDASLMSPPRQRRLLSQQSEEDTGKLTVVLDMDETLIHSIFRTGCNNFRQDEQRQEIEAGKHDFSVDLGDDEMAFVHKRPGVEKFLKELSEHFETVVFTAALPVYAKPVVETIDQGGFVKHSLFRDATVTYKGQSFVKDLSILGRDLSRVVLIDNNPLAMLASPDNAMPILSWYDDANDKELEKALTILHQMKDLKDIRPFLKKKFGFRQTLAELLTTGDASIECAPY